MILSRDLNTLDFSEYISCVEDLLDHELIQSLSRFSHHNGTDLLEHCLYVSYLSYRICKKRGLDYRSAARGGLLHDFYLYNRHKEEKPKGWHPALHPYVALENACNHFNLNETEKDIIVKHMWPITLRLPKYAETRVIVMVDKYCACMEFFKLIRNNKARHIKTVYVS